MASAAPFPGAGSSRVPALRNDAPWNRLGIECLASMILWILKEPGSRWQAALHSDLGWRMRLICFHHFPHSLGYLARYCITDTSQVRPVNCKSAALYIIISSLSFDTGALWNIDKCYVYHYSVCT